MERERERKRGRKAAKRERSEVEERSGHAWMSCF
jgi:hypothetical protein